MIEFFQQIIVEVNNIFRTLPKTFALFFELLIKTDWRQVIRVGIFFLLAMFLFSLLIFVTNWIFDSYTKNKTRVHHLKIKNNGNMASIYLLRTIDLPKQLAIRFRSNGNPMIWVSQKDTKAEEEAKAKEAEAAKEPSIKEAEEKTQPLIPDLKAPMGKKTETITASDGVKIAKDGLQKTGKFAGTIAALLANIANLLPWKTPQLSQATAQLKDIQQSTNQTIGAINTKVGSVNSLKSQVDKLGIKTTIPDDTKVIINSALQEQSNDIAEHGNVGNPDDLGLGNRLAMRNFVYDEDVWHNNLNKVDEMGGSLNYVQSRILNPGESMDIDIEILNMNEAAATITLIYKLEVIQVPQTRLPISAPREYVRGTVVCPKNSLMKRLAPFLMDLALIILAIQILALYSYIVFK